MELDDLKNTWQQSTVKKPKNTDIMELIHHKSYGPVNALKREFLKQIRLMIVLPVILLLTNTDGTTKVLQSILFWSYVVFCLGVIVVSYYNYRIVCKMEGMDGGLKSNLEKQINLLEARLRIKNIGLRIALLFFVVLAEALPYFQHYRMLDKWHSLSPFVRFGVYAAFLVLQYFASKAAFRRKFGTHIHHLKELVNELQA